jgi:citrate lyase synthetase
VRPEGSGERSQKTYKFVTPVNIEIFRASNASTIEMMKRVAGSEIAMSVSPNYIGGFIRSLEESGQP